MSLRSRLAMIERADTKRLAKRLKKSGKTFSKQKNSAEKNASDRAQKLEKQKARVSRKVLQTSLPSLVDTLSVIQAMQDAQRVMKNELGLQGIALNDAVFLPIIEGVLTVSIARHILDNNSTLPNKDKRAILNRVIASQFPDTPANSKARDKDNLLQQLYRSLGVQAPFGITDRSSRNAVIAKKPPDV